MSDLFSLDSPVPGTLPHGIYLTATADVSACGRYRYTLPRVWNPALPVLVVVALNPSTADGERDDPTVRKCCGFAARWGYGGLVIVNLYAYRATNPRELLEVDAPLGPLNQLRLYEYGRDQDVLMAWGGIHPRHRAHAAGGDAAVPAGALRDLPRADEGRRATASLDAGVHDGAGGV